MEPTTIAVVTILLVIIGLLGIAATIRKIVDFLEGVVTAVLKAVSFGVVFVLFLLVAKALL